MRVYLLVHPVIKTFLSVFRGYFVLPKYKDWNILINSIWEKYKKLLKSPHPNGFYPLFLGDKDFLSKLKKTGSVTSVPSWCPTFMQKNRKNNKWFLRYTKSDQRTVDYEGPFWINLSDIHRILVEPFRNWVRRRWFI